ncbi:MAG: V-type ATP synthase subunit C [Chloroflexi bacterium ADurb.Bin325]|nr:MAG: V-type ATP synthase subunit C [Chloroflexi bacterium ADurb.Bin325]
MPDDYGYLNARLRAMKSRLLSRRAYGELLARTSIDELLAILAETPYRASIEAALSRNTGWAALRDGLRRDLTAHLGRVRAMVMDQPNSEPAQLVRILLARWDRANLLAVLRQQIQGPAEAGGLDLLAAVGELDETALTALLHQPNLRAMIDLALQWQLPYAAALRQALPEMAARGDPAILEAALDRQHAAHIEGWLNALRPSANVSLVREVVAWERDLTNLLAALRLRQARLREYPGGRLARARADEALSRIWYLPGGSLPQELLAALLDEPTADRVYDIVAQTPHTGAWRPALAGWVEHGRLTELQQVLERELTARQIALFRADPLTIAPAIAYFAAKENEARNVRLIATGLVHGLSREQVIEELNIPG